MKRFAEDGERQRYLMRRAEELDEQGTFERHRGTGPAVPVAAAGAVGVRDHPRPDGLAVRLGGQGALGSPARADRRVLRRRDQCAADRADPHAAGLDGHAVRHRRGADAVVRGAHPPDRWTHRDTLSRVWLTRVSLVLSGLARAPLRDADRRGRSLPALRVPARIDLRRDGPGMVARAGAHRMGRCSKTSCW